MVDTAELSVVIDEFCSTMTQDFVIGDILTHLASSVVRILDADGAGVMTADKEGLTRFAFATGAPVEEMERLQELLQDGPCRDCHRDGSIINIADLAAEGSWPTFQQAALDAGLRAVTAIPLRGRDQGLGVLDIYRSTPRRLDAVELQAAQTLANLATSYLVVAADRDTARDAQQQLAQRAMYDPLTGLPVRWVFLEHLTRALSRVGRTTKQVGVLFLDLDGLKYVNDTYGHASGDRLLVDCVARITGALRPADVVARIGGDEFVVLLDEATESGAIAVARRILQQLVTPYPVRERMPAPSASIGIALTEDPDQTADTLIAHADSAMYVAKRRGRGNYQVFDPVAYDVERDASATRQRLGSNLRTALEEDQFEVHYQPIIELADGEAPSLFAVEALLRWRSPTRGLLPAAEFLGALESSGLMPQLGAWVIRSACRQLSEWDRTLQERSPRRMFVNLSIAELTQPGLTATIAAATSGTGIDAQRLTLEITETGLSNSPAMVLAAVEDLRALGCEVAIDDFGTGYSSLSRLEHLPARVIKIDGSFARDMPASPTSTAIVTAVLLLGRSLNRSVIVEGVEDEPTVQSLIDLGCNYLQGYHLALPMPAAELESFAAAV